MWQAGPPRPGKPSAPETRRRDGLSDMRWTPSPCRVLRRPPQMAALVGVVGPRRSWAGRRKSRRRGWIVATISLRDRPLHGRRYPLPDAPCCLVLLVPDGQQHGHHVRRGDLVNPSPAKPGHGVVPQARPPLLFRTSLRPSTPHDVCQSQSRPPPRSSARPHAWPQADPPPVRATFRFAWATARASVSVVHRVEPSPISCRLPLMVRRWT